MRSNVSSKIAGAMAIIALVFLIGAVYVGATSEEKPKSIDYSLDLEARATDGTAFVHGATNLPDGARLEVVIDRLYRLRDRGVWHAARVGETQGIVEGGRWQAEVPIDESKWITDLDRRTDAGEIDPIEAVLPDLRATVIFTPLIDQPDEIRQSMGTNFERLSRSVLAVEEGDHWVLRRQKDFSWPLNAEMETKLLSPK